jgi:hypothetical protein
MFNQMHNTELTLESVLTMLVSSDGHLQKDLSHSVFESSYKEFFSSLSPDDKVWISNCQPDSTSWFSAPPIQSKNLWMPNSAFQLAILTRLRQPIFDGTTSCVVGENGNRISLIDSTGMHALGCPKGAGIHERHRLIRDTIFQFSKETGLQVRLEPLHVLQDNENRPPDLFFTARPVALDSRPHATYAFPTFCGR